MSESHSISEWIDQLRDGNPQAAQGIWNRFYHRLVAAATRHMRTAGVRVVDGDDIAMEAFTSFFARVESGHFPDLRDRQGLWRLLLTIVERRAKNQIRKERAKKRGEGNVRGDSGSSVAMLLRRTRDSIV